MTPENIENLKENEVFVFGSNQGGFHLGGAANLAMNKFGAIFGQAEGLQGQSYAIPTVDYNFNKLSIKQIEEHVDKFLKFAEETPDKIFYVTKIGCGIAGYKTDEIRELFINKKIPENVELPREFT